MKKQIKQLSLGKKTISNLSVLDMKKIVGGYWTIYCHGASAHCTGGCGQTQNGNTCPGHNTCYTC